MAINFIDFQPSDIAPFQFQATLDGTQYNVIVTYNIFGQRYYINVYTTQGTLIVSAPMVGSPDGWDIDLLLRKFTSTLVYRVSKNQFEVSDAKIAYPNFGARSDWMLDSNNNIFILDGPSQMIA